MSNWPTITSLQWWPIDRARFLRDGQAVLTWHKSDLLPVAASFVGGKWYRQTEGPEDLNPPLPGCHDLLYREPTVFAMLPLPCDIVPKIQEPPE